MTNKNDILISSTERRYFYVNQSGNLAVERLNRFSVDPVRLPVLLEDNMSGKKGRSGVYTRTKPMWGKGKKCPQLSGENQWKWNGGKKHDSYGYALIASHFHPFAQYGGYVFEHRLVMEKHLGRYLKPTEIIHHKNGIKTDNRIENLKLFENHREHILYHYNHGYKDGF